MAKKKKAVTKTKRRRASTGKMDYKKMMVPLLTSMGAGFFGEMVTKDNKPLIPHFKPVGIEGTFGPLIIGFGALSKGKSKNTILEIGSYLTAIGANKLGSSLGKSFVKKKAEQKAKSVSAGWMGEDEEFDGALDAYGQPELLGYDGEGTELFGYEAEFEPDENYYNQPVDLGFQD